MNKNVKTTVIGSYPAVLDNMVFMNDFFNQNESSWNKIIEYAVNDMVKAGVDIVSDGQTRDPFLIIFARKLKGCRVRDQIEVTDKVRYNGSITVDDQRYVKKILPKNKDLVGLIAGPYTLARSCVDMYYNDVEKLAFDFARALHEEAQQLQKHVDIISVDEPFFSVEMPDYAKDLINIITGDISCPTRLHICGDVSNIVSKIVEIPVDILSHEFKASPKLFNSFKDVSFPQQICLGSVRSDNQKVETIDEITEHIQKGINVFGDKICQLSPDCGLRNLPRDVAFQKLKNLVTAGEKIYG